MRKSKRFVLPADGREQIGANLLAFALSAWPGERVEVEARPYVEPRTLKQNAALFAVAYPPIMEHVGLRGDREKQELHEIYCGLYFGTVERPIVGTRPLRTTTTNEEGERDVLSREQFGQFFEFVCKRAADDLDLVISEPNPFWKEAA